MSRFILALDQGTTSSRAIVFDRQGTIRGLGQCEFEQILPTPGHVEHDPEVLWQSQIDAVREAMRVARIGIEVVAAIGIANQRETTILWDRETGRPVSHAIVWQSRVSAPLCEAWRRDGYEELVSRRTGLVIDAYFSASKIRYLLDTVEGLRTEAEAGRILFGTVDTYLLWRLTGGKIHATDSTNASRTMLFNIHTLQWDEELLHAFDIPPKMLPEVKPSSHIFGMTSPDIFGQSVPVAGIAGDQQAATFGQACFQPGTAKNTYGTGCFVLMNTGSEAIASRHRLLTTIGWQLDGQVTYCLEGAIFIAGAAVQWLRDGLGIIRESVEVEAMTNSVPDNGGVYFVPAFVGLGAPFWDPDARGAVFGLTRGTQAGHLARAAVESVAFQSRAVLDAMAADSGCPLTELRADGGATRNDFLLQFQADLLQIPVHRPQVQETTALGAAYLAGLAVGYWKDREEISRHWQLERTFQPARPAEEMDSEYALWQRAAERSLKWAHTS